MQSELRLVKEFRKKRALMQRELEEVRDVWYKRKANHHRLKWFRLQIKDSMFATEKKHKTILSKMEQKFFEEKVSFKFMENFMLVFLNVKLTCKSVTQNLVFTKLCRR